MVIVPCSYLISRFSRLKKNLESRANKNAREIYTCEIKYPSQKFRIVQSLKFHNKYDLQQLVQLVMSANNAFFNTRLNSN